MRERKHVKFRVDMYDDTKFKIIDMKPERDLIHYIWTRLVTLAGKVNLDGDLYISKNLPYTMETLAIEFNRGIDQIKLALNVLIELEMIEFNEDKIYSVKNFSKHQNIKAKEKIKSKDNKENTKNEEMQENVSNKETKSKEKLEISIEDENLKGEIYDNENVKIEVNSNKNKKSENKTSQNNMENIKSNMRNIRGDDIVSLEIINDDIIKKKVDKNNKNMSDEKINNNLQDHIPILLEVKKNKKVSKPKKNKSDINTIEEKNEDKSMFCMYEDNEERPLGEGESIIAVWDF